MLLDGQVAVITGGASERGIGRATATLFAEHGARVAILDIDGDGARKVGRNPGPKHQGYRCDVRKQKEVESIFAKVSQDLGSPSVLVNKAGITQPRRIAEIEEADYDAVLDVNLRGTFLCSKAALPYLRKRKKGSIICISSVSAEREGGIFGGPHYGAAKAGILGLAKAIPGRWPPRESGGGKRGRPTYTEDLNETEEWFTFWKAGEEQESIRANEPPAVGDSVGPL